MIGRSSRYSSEGCWAALLNLAVALSVTGCDRPVEPAVFATPASYQAGTIWNQTHLERAFTVINTTSRDVAITLSQTSCGCASLELSSKSIPAGGQIRAALRATLGGRTGPQQFVATLYTDHEAFPVVQLQITAEVGFSQIDGTLPIDLGLFHPGESVNRLITLPEGHENSRLIDCQESSSGSLRTAVDDATEFRIRLTGEAPRRPGPFALNATATASGGFWTSRNLELRGRVVPDWQFPERVALGFVRPGNTATREILLKRTLKATAENGNEVTCSGAAPFEIETSEEPEGHIRAKIRFVNRGQAGSQVAIAVFSIGQGATATEIARIELYAVGLKESE